MSAKVASEVIRDWMSGKYEEQKSICVQRQAKVFFYRPSAKKLANC
jgi:hypothetical protein